MEQESKKRGRDQEQEVKYSPERAPKKKDLSDHDLNNIINTEEDINQNELNNKNTSYRLSDTDLALGVFDFPWLNEAMISEDWHLEDTFSSFLQDTNTTSATDTSGQYCFCESPDTFMTSLDFTVDKFEENVWSLEMETVSSLLNQPLQQEGV
ncbi:hypothetical protein K2173_001575 [Erythroxylum novogranatense]|uniref:Uncharacterized protein n=1 Tax=Erythroxylum novogranatense TaxID=1862640 RepID=A0AAV8S5E3_9ROSI|nr:hypothetical protein K2173_001575 [Erythroxylum novogranatense]